VAKSSSAFRIPNTEVKTFRADDTWGASPWESRSSPGKQAKGYLLGDSLFVFLVLGQRTGVPPVRSTLQESASGVAVWRKARPLFVYTNTEVKTFRADDTWGASPWESRSSPGKQAKRLSLTR